MCWKTSDMTGLTGADIQQTDVLKLNVDDDDDDE